MNAVITLLASLVIAVFFIGPYLAARFAIARLIVKQPAKGQTSTEEIARALFFSVPVVAIACFLVWLYSHTRYVFNPALLDCVFASQSSFGQRWSALYGLWPIRDILIVTYLEVMLYVCFVSLAVHFSTRPAHASKRFFLDFVLRHVTSSYLKSEWDVLAGGILLPPKTEVLADVETKGGKIFLGTLAGVTTNSDGSLRHLQLSNPSIRARKGAAKGSSGVQQTPDEPYVFQDSFYFVIFASEIANVNFRFALPHSPHTEVARAPLQSPPVSSPNGTGDSQVLREQPLEEELTGLSGAKRRELIEQLGSLPEGANEKDKPLGAPGSPQ